MKASARYTIYWLTGGLFGFAVTAYNLQSFNTSHLKMAISPNRTSEAVRPDYITEDFPRNLSAETISSIQLRISKICDRSAVDIARILDLSPTTAELETAWVELLKLVSANDYHRAIALLDLYPCDKGRPAFAAACASIIAAGGPAGFAKLADALEDPSLAFAGLYSYSPNIVLPFFKTLLENGKAFTTNDFALYSQILAKNPSDREDGLRYLLNRIDLTTASLETLGSIGDSVDQTDLDIILARISDPVLRSKLQGASDRNRIIASALDPAATPYSAIEELSLLPGKYEYDDTLTELVSRRALVHGTEKALLWAAGIEHVEQRGLAVGELFKGSGAQSRWSPLLTVFSSSKLMENQILLDIAEHKAMSGTDHSLDAQIVAQIETVVARSTKAAVIWNKLRPSVSP